MAELQGTPILGWGCLSTLQPPLVAPLDRAGWLDGEKLAKVSAGLGGLEGVVG